MTEYDYKHCFDDGHQWVKDVLTGGSDTPPFVAQMSEFALAYTGNDGREFYSNPEVFVEGTLRTCAELGFDTADLIWDVYDIECEALGGEMTWFPDLSPAINNSKPIITSEKDLARLSPPDPHRDGRMPFVRDCLHIYKEMTGRAQTLRYCGPFTLAAQCMQFEQLILQIQENPQFVHKVFRFLVEEVQAPYLNSLFKDFPEAGTNGSDAIGSLPFLTEEILDEFSIPYILRLRELCGGDPRVQVDNWWGDSFAESAERFWEKKLVVTPAYLKIQDPDLFRVGTQRARAFADTLGCPLQFGVDNHVLQRGPVEEITRRIHEYMEVGTSGPHGRKFFLYLCSLSAQTPTEHVQGAIDAVNRYRAGDRPYAGEVLSGASGESSGRPGDRGYWMGIGSVEDLKKNLRQTLEEASKSGKKAIFQEIYDAVMEFDDEECASLVSRALDEGETPADILDEALIAAMDTIGDLFSSGILFVPEMLLSAKAMKAGLAILRPILTATKEPPKGVVVLATVQGDLHDIGKNLVGMMLEGAGFQVVDLGVNIKAEEIIDKSRELGADIVGLSALLTTTMPYMKIIIEEIHASDVPTPVMVGGAPVTREFAENVNADGYADNAAEAVRLAKFLVAEADAAPATSFAASA